MVDLLQHLAIPNFLLSNLLCLTPLNATSDVHLRCTPTSSTHSPPMVSHTRHQSLRHVTHLHATWHWAPFTVLRRMEPWRKESRSGRERVLGEIVSFKESVHRELRDPIRHRRNQVLLTTNLLQCLGYEDLVGFCERVFARVVLLWELVVWS